MDTSLMPRSEGCLPPVATINAARIWQFFAIAACALALLAGVLFWDLQRVAAVRATFPQAEIIERNLLILNRDLLDMEIAQMVYLRTHDDRDLETYSPVIADVPTRIDALRQEIANPTSRANLERLAPVVTATLDEFA